MVRRAFRSVLSTRFIRAELARAGYEPRRQPPIDLRGMPDLDPPGAWTRCGGRPVLVDVDLARCRSLDLVGFSCAPDDPNPFVETVRGIVDGSVRGYDGSPLQRYYETFTPARILDLYGWPERTCSAALHDRPASAAAPWQETPGEHMAVMRQNFSARDHAQFGDPVAGDDSWVDWGPVSPAKAQIEFRRLARVADSIGAKGYAVDPATHDHITAHLMLSGGEFAAWIMNGHHRIAALAALGYRLVPVVILPDIYRREEVDSWPGVASGAFTRAQALAAFDLVFRGRRPPDPGCDWIRPALAERRRVRVVAG